MEFIYIILGLGIVVVSGAAGCITDSKGIYLRPPFWWMWGALTGIMAVAIALHGFIK